MAAHKRWKKIVIIGLMTGGILFLHYFTFPDLKYYHAVYRMLFYLPLVLGCFWFGLRGAISISLSVSIFYVPFVIKNWQGLSFEDFDKLLEGLLFVTVSLILGVLVERERQKQQALVRAKSLAAMGAALSEVAHDMKTPLIAIGGFAGQVCGKLQPQDSDRRKLEIVMQETARLEALVKNMLDFGKPLEVQPEQTRLNELVLQTMETVRRVAQDEGVELEADLDPYLPSLMLDAPRVKRVLINLMTNAVQASPEGERVRVKTRQNKQKVRLEVIDHGCGIPEQTKKSIFHPFVSTKKGGTGLGLAISKKIVKAHGGEISFQSDGEKGATFTLRFPLGESGESKVI
jgi:two-component system sensor histidine kinase HydH